MLSARLKTFFPDRPQPMRILRGPFRGAIVIMNPRYSLRKLFGLYEHELNSWLEEVLPRVTRVLDVGAHYGYYSFGCAAAFRRLGKAAEIIAFEPQQESIEILREGISKQPRGAVRFRLLQSLTGSEIRPGAVTLDAIEDCATRTDTLVKIDVEGAELDVLAGASSWINPKNYFLIEIHQGTPLESITGLFAKHGMELTTVDQRPLPFVGREMRSEENWWLVSNLG
jgi:hypothetical protein